MSRKLVFSLYIAHHSDINDNYVKLKMTSTFNLLTREKTRMTLTADTYGEDFLENGELDLFEEDPDHPCNQVNGLDIYDGYSDDDIHDGVGVSGLGSGRELLQQIWGGHCQTPAGVSS